MTKLRGISLFAVAAVSCGAGLVGGVAATQAAASRVSGGSPAAQALLSSELAKIPSSLITTSALDNPPGDETRQAYPANGDDWLWFTATTAGNPAVDAMRAEWQESLVVADFADAAPAQGIDPAYGYFTSVRLNDQAGTPVDSDQISVPSPTSVDAPTIGPDINADETAITSQIQGNAGLVNASVVSIQFTQLPVLAVDVVIRANDPASFVASLGSNLYTLLGDETDYNGRFLEVVDSAGTPVLASWYTLRLNSGSSWVDPQYGASAGGYGVSSPAAGLPPLGLPTIGPVNAAR